MISTDDTPEEEDEDEDESAVLREGLQRIADSIKPPNVNVSAPVTVQSSPRPTQMIVRGLYDGRAVDLTITMQT